MGTTGDRLSRACSIIFVLIFLGIGIEPLIAQDIPSEDTVRIDSASLGNAQIDSVRLDSIFVDSSLVDTTQIDSSLIDTAVVDTSFTPDPQLARWFPQKRPSLIGFQPPAATAKLYQLDLPGLSSKATRLQDGRYRIDYTLNEKPFGLPIILTQEEYRVYQLDQMKRKNWADLSKEVVAKSQVRRGLLDLSLTIPGGRESGFTTIFGTPEVNLRVNGAATMNIGASIQKSADPQLPPDQQTRVDPTFDQNLQLNIQGNIGDKLAIQTDWDTERQFDFQNRLRIAYTGYEDEVIQSIEMGNVSMQTGNSLIRGGGSLFGIKSIVEMGPLKFTSIVSQQKGDSNVETLSGGSQEQVIQIRPAAYEDDRHFFLDFYTRQEFERSLSNPQQLFQILQLADLNVWILRENIQTEEGARRAVALVDLGVRPTTGNRYLAPSNVGDAFTDELLNAYRDPTVPVSAAELGVENEADFETGFFSRLEEGIDYTINKVTGSISLRRVLGSREVLAVSYSYLSPTNELVQVGDLNRGGSDRIYLKMIRPKNISTDNKVYDLTMRNIYSLGVSGIQSRENLEISIQFTEGNVSKDRLPGRTSTLLQDLGLDRVDEQGGRNPDNIVDFGTGTLDLAEGKLMFPYLEPFGSRIETLLDQVGANTDEINRLVYRSLYEDRISQASQDARNNFYRIDGIVKGGVQDSYSLGFALVEGSVKVIANGVELQEGVDYQVDYSFGTITILNPQYTAPGQDLRIEYENQAFTTIEQKTFTGIRAEYNVAPNVFVGGTLFRYNEKPLDDKIRIGDEPINNTVIGLDANAAFDVPFLTRALDAVPLIQTKEPSSFSMSGEFAQLRPGVAQTRATSAAIKRGDLNRDEEQGLSFIDDFEGSNIKISLINATRWYLAASPAAIPGYLPDAPWFTSDADLIANPVSLLEARQDRADLRSEFSWYTIPRNISTILGNVSFTPESEPVKVTDVFPGKETQNPQEEFITTLDVYYAPNDRGIYAYPNDLTLYQNEPERTWGGMTTVLPSGQEDFTKNNIEYLEFWVQPILPGGQDVPAGELTNYDGTLYLDLGILSEDVVPNSKLNSEDGLATSKETLQPDSFTEPRSLIPSIPPAPLGQFSNTDRDIEDVGLDGLPNTGGVNNFNEGTLFNDFIEIARQQLGQGSPLLEKILRDPSNDDYIYYGQSIVNSLPLHERFHRMLGRPDGNTPINQSDKRAVTNRPDTEGLINPSIIEQNNSYFQYEIQFNPADATDLQPGRNPENYIVDRVSGTNQNDRWYLVRIPLTDFKRKYGDINSFQNISYVRFWMSGYKKSFTLRFASLEFVGSQWRKADTINLAAGPDAELKITSINIEENSNREPIPYRQPDGGIRSVNRGSQLQSLANEQSLVLNVNNLGPEGLLMIKKVIPGGVNLLNYSNMRMFVHGEGYFERDDVEIVLRFGSDLENNYYEYRQPVTPSDPDYPFQGYNPDEAGRLEEESIQVWLYDENNMNLVLSAFNALKQLRDQLGALDPSEIYERDDLLPDGAPGAIVAIKGTPSLSRVSEIGIGVRNPFSTENPNGKGVPILQNAQFWFNELRVSGFDNENGWAATMKASAKLADFATVNGNITRQTNGFGTLDSRLGQRRTSELTSYDLSTSIRLDKFLPARYGWNIPLAISTRSSVTTPKYLPDQGDIRFTDYKEAIFARDDLDQKQKDDLIQNRLESIQTTSEAFSMNLSNLSKSNSKSKLAQLTLDNTSLNVAYNTSTNSSPGYEYQDAENVSASLGYSLRFRNVRTVRPFGYFDETPLLRRISGLRLGVMPSGMSANISGQRNYGEARRRVLGEDIEQLPLQQTHGFNYNTSFNLSYTFIPSISTSFQSSSAYDLGQISTRPAGFTGVDSAAFERIPTFELLKDIVTDTLKPRRSSYSEGYSASWQPSISSIQFLDWLTYSTRYSGGYQWQNSPQGSGLGARIGNSYRLDHTLRMNTERLFDKIGPYRNLVEADKEAEKEREELKKLRELRKEERKLQKEEEKQRKKEERRLRKEAEEIDPDSLRLDSLVADSIRIDSLVEDSVQMEQMVEDLALQEVKSEFDSVDGDTLHSLPTDSLDLADSAAVALHDSLNLLEAEEESRSWLKRERDTLRIPLTDQALFIGRKLILAPLSFRSIDVSYSQNRSGAQAGYLGSPQAVQAVFGQTSPPFLYRIGVSDKLGPDDFIDNLGGATTLQLPAQNSIQNNLTLGTSLSPFKTISIDLSWATQWDDRISETTTIGVDNSRSTVRTSSGTVTSSVWAFGPGYESFFRAQLKEAFDDLSIADGVIQDQNGNGLVALTPASLEKDFRDAYLFSANKRFGDKGFIPLPLPQWRINWTGIEKLLPFIGNYMQRASISHSYQARYRLGWAFNNDAGNPVNQSIGSYSLQYLREEFDPNSINIEQRFSPLLQLSVSWNGALRTSLGMESSKLTSLALSNSQITERSSRGLKASVGYSFRQFRLPFFRRQTNSIDLTVNGSYLEDVEQRYQLGEDLAQVFSQDPASLVQDPSLYNFVVIPPTGQARINANVVLGYRFSSTLQANAEYAFSKIIPKSSRTFERTTHDIRVNVRINIRSN